MNSLEATGIEPEVARGADLIEIVAGLLLPVARVGHLMALKLLAREHRTSPVARVYLVNKRGGVADRSVKATNFKQGDTVTVH